MSMIQTFQHFIAEKKLFTAKDKLLIAVSGGVDSVVLCELCYNAGFDFAIAHCNFKLRDPDSDEDENWVANLASKYHVPFFSKQFDTTTYANEQGLSIQEAARNLRYSWFKELMMTEGKKVFDFLLTAHHADDNVETLLMNFFKGTGITGLTGIKAKDSNMGSHLIRPLLFASKKEILQFANQQQLKWREDISNASNKYTRNFFRNELLPSLEEQYPSVRENLLNNISRFEEVQMLYNHTVQHFSKKLLFKLASGYGIPVLALMKTTAHKTILYELLKSFSFSVAQIPEVLKLCDAPSGKYVSSATHRIIRNRKWLLLTTVNSSENTIHLIEKKDLQFNAGSFEISVESISQHISVSTEKSIACIDASDLVFPLLLRKWKQGDYFYPLGMDKKKKLSRFFIDEKLSLSEKENVWVIESANRIVWVVGRRIDNRFRVKPSTKEMLRLTVSE